MEARCSADAEGATAALANERLLALEKTWE